MNLFENISNSWSKYEINIELAYLLLIFTVSILTIYFSTKEKKILILSILSFTVATLSNLIGIYIVNTLFKIDISEIFKMIPLITYILILSNLGTLIGYYISKRNSKGFKISNVRKEYYSDTIKQTIFLLLLGSSTLLFLSVQTEVVISISILSTVIAVWSTYAISKYILK
ncbi:hypothetical protein A2400_00360 [candidate division WS6 bacterium RIFOXYB1_FULL_33_14]|uniref:Uncharacterized protein n=1 Tax=candidate division WS6 bacterium RIFOXYB1_FULL_33_14 TaxID=1817896 RepID=A0A1F4UJN5_9BACT|nr:MAG: hypothetical protein A2400_00360 [candidate division WS6 bacterium RIFOXYB1_FULL_33_14]